MKKRAIKNRVLKTQWLCFGYGVMIIMPNEETSDFNISSSAFTGLLDSFNVMIVTPKSKQIRERIFKRSWTDWTFILPMWQKSYVVF